MKGQYLKENRTGFTGIIGDNCKGTIQFQDGTTTTIYYNEEKYQIVLGEEKTGQRWEKGKNLQSQSPLSRLYNIQIIKIIKMVRHQTKIYQISKEKTHVAVSAEMPSRN